jgi:hypothetical protein
MLRGSGERLFYQNLIRFSSPNTRSNQHQARAIFRARDSIEILWYLIPVRCTIELTEKEQWGSYPLFLKKGMPVHGRGLDISMPELK